MRFSLFFLFFFSFSLRRPCLRDTSARNGFVFSRQPPRLLVTGRRRNGRRGVKTKVVSVNHSDDAVSVVFLGFFLSALTGAPAGLIACFRGRNRTSWYLAGDNSERPRAFSLCL